MRTTLGLIVVNVAMLSCFMSGTFSPTRAANIPQPEEREQLQRVCLVRTGVEDGRLNVRSGPGLSFAVLSVLEEGESVALSSEASERFWLYVHTHSHAGWVHSKFIFCERKNIP